MQWLGLLFAHAVLDVREKAASGATSKELRSHRQQDFPNVGTNNPARKRRPKGSLFRLHLVCASPEAVIRGRDRRRCGVGVALPGSTGAAPRHPLSGEAGASRTSNSAHHPILPSVGVTVMPLGCCLPSSFAPLQAGKGCTSEGDDRLQRRFRLLGDRFPSLASAAPIATGTSPGVR